MNSWEKRAVGAVGFAFGLGLTMYNVALSAPALLVVGIGFWLTGVAIPDLTRRVASAGVSFLAWAGFGATTWASWKEFGADAIYLGWSAFVALLVIVWMPITFTWCAYGTVKREAKTKRLAQ